MDEPIGGEPVAEPDAGTLVTTDQPAYIVAPWDPVTQPLPALNAREAMFVNAYLGECYGNATEAAALAGYHGDRPTLATLGWKALKKVEVRAHIDARLAAAAGDSMAVLRELWRVASSPMNHNMVVTKPATYDQDGTKLDDMHVRLDYTSKVRALELIMRYNRMLEEKAPVEVTIKALVGVDLSKL